MKSLPARHSAPRVLIQGNVRHVRLGFTVLNAVRHALLTVLADVRSARGRAMSVLEGHMDPSVSRSVQQGAPILDVIRTEHATNVKIQICMGYTATLDAAVFV